MTGRVACLSIVVSVLTLAAEAAGQTVAPGGAPAPSANQQADAQGKIVAVQGRVEHAQARQEAWRNATLFQPLFVDERVRTLTASRASVLFVDETQVKLNAGSVLTVQSIRRADQSSTTFELLRGGAWFRTRKPGANVTVRTPAAAAALRGTEIAVDVGADDTTVLTVIEGAVELSNAQGSLTINAGEEGTARPGQAPTKRLVLNPADAVQWTLFYPAAIAWSDLPTGARSSPAAAGFERLQQGDAAAAADIFRAAGDDPWARVGLSMALVAQGNAAEALTAVASTPSVERREELVDLLAQRAAAALAAGDARAARTALDQALAASPTALRPLVLLSTLELTQNRKDEALAAAARAVAAHPKSTGAHIAAAEAAQAAFDLRRARRHLDLALQIDPSDLHALVNRARIRFGTGDIAGAREDAARAATVSAGDAQVKSLQGFIRLAEGDAPAAERDFTSAAQADPSLGEPHLGLGLVHFRRHRTNDGLLEMLTATLLEPGVSLYQSYLGKAYYQLERFSEATAALSTAKRLDPRDPTPWLYASFLLRDQNRQVDALAELRRAIALNDNRAVYRSRLLLDRDLATKNVSLAQVYRQLGVEAWGAFEAQSSLEADYTNASAHLFLADTYGRLPDRVQAQGSELLQYFLYAPVNRNSFNAFNEYTALLEEPRRQLSMSGEIGSRHQGSGDVVTRSGDERFAHNAFIDGLLVDGARPRSPDSRILGFFQGKVALGRRSDLFVSATGTNRKYGADFERIAAFAFPIVQVRQFTETPNPLIDNRFVDAEGTVGFRHDWAPKQTLTAAVGLRSLETRERNPFALSAACRSFFSGFFILFPGDTVSAYELTNPIRSSDFQVQQVVTLGRHQILAGAQHFRQRKERRCAESIWLFDEPLADVAESVETRDRTTSAYVRAELELTSRVHATLGARHQNVEYTDMFGDDRFEIREWDPLAGVAVRVTRSTIVRAAAFRNVNSDFIGSKISPATVSGFVIERNEFPTARRREANLGVEQAFSRVFASLRGFVRETEVPLLLSDSDPLLASADADTRTTGGGGYVNVIVARRFSAFADDVLARTDAGVFVRQDNLLRAGLNYIHEAGVLLRVTHGYVTQRYSRTSVFGLPDSSYHVTDLEGSYEFGRKAGLLTVTVNNLFDQKFSAVVEGLSIAAAQPRRQILVRIRWRV